MKTITSWIVSSCLALGVCLCLSGCEAQSANASISVEPSSAVLRMGESVEFTASGGYDYRWSLDDTTIGTLSNTTGPTTTYTSLVSPAEGTTLPQVLHCTSFIEGASGGTTNNTATETSVEVYINHIY
jgi:hypothetical protein